MNRKCFDTKTAMIKFSAYIYIRFADHEKDPKH